MNLILQQQMQLLDSEIKWCEKNPLPDVVDEQFRQGFIAGLRQAKRLLLDADKGRVIECVVKQEEGQSDTQR